MAIDGIDAGLFDTVVKLVNIGFAGVGIVVLLLLFIILMRDRPADEGAQRLRNRFLTWGMSFAFFCGILAFLGPLFAPRPDGVRPEMLLSFSPRFESQSLPPPTITLPDGHTVTPGVAFAAQTGQVLVSVDDALKYVAALKQTAVTLAQTASATQQQADAAVATLTSKEGAPAAPVAAAQQTAEDASKDSQAAAIAITSAINNGDLNKLDQQRKVLDRAARASLGARSRVIKAF